MHINWDVSDDWTINSISSYEEFYRDTLRGDEEAGDGTSGRLTGSAILIGPKVPGALYFINEVDDRIFMRNRDIQAFDTLINKDIQLSSQIDGPNIECFVSDVLSRLPRKLLMNHRRLAMGNGMSDNAISVGHVQNSLG